VIVGRDVGCILAIGVIVGFATVENWRNADQADIELPVPSERIQTE
jgi:hypothetical protein